MDQVRALNALERKDDKRAIRRVRSPSRPRAWLSHSNKPKSVGHFYKHRDECLGYKPGFNNQRYHSTFYHPAHIYKRDPLKVNPHSTASPGGNDWDREERERDGPRVSVNEGSSVKKNNTSQPVSSGSTSSRDKDTQFTAGQIDRNQSRERDHRGGKGKDGERSRDTELPSTVSQTAARDRAIQQKRKEIDEMYYQDCEMFGVVTKMLIAKDPSLEQPIQSSLQENLRDIGERCVVAMQKFIEEYDSRPSH